MFLVKTYLDKSTIDGIGLFALDDIKASTTIYKPSSGLDMVLSEDQFKKLLPLEQGQIMHYGYLSSVTGKWNLAFDDIRFCNHSKDPNIKLSYHDYVTTRDIQAGEEIVCDYSEFEKLRESVKE